MDYERQVLSLQNVVVSPVLISLCSDRLLSGQIRVVAVDDQERVNEHVQFANISDICLCPLTVEGAGLPGLNELCKTFRGCPVTQDCAVFGPHHYGTGSLVFESG